MECGGAQNVKLDFGFWSSTYFELDSPVLDGQQLFVDNNRSSLTIVKSFKVTELCKAWVCGRSLTETGV